MPRNLYCSRCDKSQHEIKKLIKCSAFFICDECVLACVSLLLVSDSEAPNQELQQKTSAILIGYVNEAMLAANEGDDKLKELLRDFISHLQTLLIEN